MSKLNKFFKGISLLLSNPALINKVLDAPEVNQKEIAKKYNLDKGLKTVDISELIPNLNETVSPFSFLDGGSTPLDLLLLKSLAKQINNCEYFEIGTWRGESVANVATVAKHCTTLNLPDATMQQMGLNKDYIASHRFYSEKLSNVTHLQGNSIIYDYASLNKKFDLIFIDGDHHYESVKSDTANAFKLLKDDNSIIVWHDYGSNPTDVRWDVLKGLMDGTPNDKKDKLYRVSNTLCAIYTNRNLNTYFPKEFSRPTSFFNLQITSNKL